MSFKLECRTPVTWMRWFQILNICRSLTQRLFQVLSLHEKYLDTCLKECLLASQDLLNILTKIMATCLVFADHVKKFSDSISAIGSTIEKSHVSAEKLNQQTKLIQLECSHDSFQHYLKTFESKFDKEVSECASNYHDSI